MPSDPKLPSTLGFPCLQQALHSEEEQTQTSDPQYKGHLFIPPGTSRGGGSCLWIGQRQQAACVSLQKETHLREVCTRVSWYVLIEQALQ